MLRVAILSVALFATFCTTYQPLGLSGGFSETQLAGNVYQVRFQGNGYTSTERTSQFLLRRAAELALEKGHRYFTLADPQTRNKSDALGTFPGQSATVTLLDESEAGALDAVIVIRETDQMSGGKLSPQARKTLAEVS
jgi:hypothetical protein